MLLPSIVFQWYPLHSARDGTPQPQTLIQTDNSTANEVLNNNVQPKQTKAMDVTFHWLRYRMSQAQFRFHLIPGPFNIGGYWTRYCSPANHINFCREILTPVAKVRALFKTGCPKYLLWGYIEPVRGSLLSQQGQDPEDLQDSGGAQRRVPGFNGTQ